MEDSFRMHDCREVDGGGGMFKVESRLEVRWDVDGCTGEVEGLLK